MKERKYNKTKMKQIVDSHWKLFNKQTNLIASGNVIANTQYSNVIRPWKETECNGRTNPFGRLMEFDLQGFKKHAIPDRILNVIKDKNRENSLILYMFYVTKDGVTEPFCWLLTNTNNKYITHVIICRFAKNFDKRVSAAKEAMSYICDLPDEVPETIEDKEILENIIKSIEARHSPELLNIMESALKEYLTRRYGRLDEEKYDLLLNLYASRLYQALTDPMYSDAGITLK